MFNLLTSVNKTLLSLSGETRIRRALLWNLIASLAGRSSGLIASIILSRLLSKEVFGEFSIVQSTILTLGVLAGFGTGLTATKHIAETFRTDPERTGRILALSIILAIVFGCLITFLLLLSAHKIASQVLAAPNLAYLLRLASISILASALSGAQSGALAGFEEFGVLSRVNIYTGVINVVALTIGVMLGGIVGALWGVNIAAAGSCYLGAIALNSVCKKMGIVPDYTHCMQEWLVMWRFSLPTMLANALVMTVTWICNAMLVRQDGGFAEMATYNIVTQWRQLALFLPGIVGQVFLPVMSSQKLDGGQYAMKSKYLKINLIIAIPILFCMSILSPFIMALYGENYVHQWPAFIVVQLAAFTQILQSPTVISWAAEGRMFTNLITNVIWGLTLVVLSWFLLKLGALGLGLALLISFFVCFVIILLVK